MSLHPDDTRSDLQSAIPNETEVSPTVLSVTEWDTVESGPATLCARYTDLRGAPIHGATVMATGDTICAPVTLKEQARGEYSVNLCIPEDSDGMRSSVKIVARKRGVRSATSYVNYFIADKTWVVRNDHVERQLLRLCSEYPQHTSLEHVTGYEGYKTYAITIADNDCGIDPKTNILFSQSHGNEPGATAAMMDVIHQLLTGQSQESEDTGLPRDKIFKHLRLVFVPIENPSGRERSPVQYWCDQIGAEAHYAYSYGKLVDIQSPSPVRGAVPFGSKILPVMSMFDRTEHGLDPTYPIALRFEQVDENIFIELFFGIVPLRTIEVEAYKEICRNIENEPMYRTTQWQLVKKLLDKYVFKVAVDVHQGAVKSDQDATTGKWRFEDAGQICIRDKGLLGYNYDQLEYAHCLAARVEKDWKAKDFEVVPRNPLKSGVFAAMNITDFVHMYGEGNPAGFFMEESKGPGTTKRMQKQIHVSGLQSIIEFVLEAT